MRSSMRSGELTSVTPGCCITSIRRHRRNGAPGVRALQCEPGRSDIARPNVGELVPAPWLVEDKRGANCASSSGPAQSRTRDLSKSERPKLRTRRSSAGGASSESNSAIEGDGMGSGSASTDLERSARERSTQARTPASDAIR